MGVRGNGFKLNFHVPTINIILKKCRKVLAIKRNRKNKSQHWSFQTSFWEPWQRLQLMKRNEAKALLKWLMNSIVELNIGQIYQELSWRIEYFMNKKQGNWIPLTILKSMFYDILILISLYLFKFAEARDGSNGASMASWIPQWREKGVMISSKRRHS